MKAEAAPETLSGVFWTGADMRAVEGAAMAAPGGLSAAQLMARAGAGALAAWAEWRGQPVQAGARVLVLCGPGNNGGDGYVMARALRGAGAAVTVFAYGAAGTEAAASARAAYEAAGGLVQALPESGALPEGAGEYDLLIDALFGTGLTRPLAPGLVATLAEVRAAARLAVDLPSGLCADSGRVLGGLSLRPFDLTVSFAAPRLGHFLAEGPGLCGALRLADIGLGAYAGAAPGAVRRGQIAAAALHKPMGHKFDHGHALILSGPAGQGGAARLAARAALRMGAGLVTLGAPKGALAEHAAQLNAVMLAQVEGPEDLAGLLQDRRITALALGPGLGAERAAALLPVALAGGAGRGLVLDADALRLLAARPDLQKALPPGTVLTPHGGEFAALFPDLAARLAEVPTKGPAFSKVEAARYGAARLGVTLLLKGPDTVIAGPEGAAVLCPAFYEDAVPWLATAGAGDVLTGLIAGLLARGLAPFAAAESAALLHQRAARAFGPGLIAEDLPEALPGVLRAALAERA